MKLHIILDVALKDETERWKSSLSRAFLRSGVASFNLGRYLEAKNCFLKGQQHQDEMGIKQWITWCDEKMEKLGIKTDEVEKAAKQIESNIASVESEKPKGPINDLKMESTKSISSVTDEISSLHMPLPKIKHDWYQTEIQVL